MNLLMPSNFSLVGSQQRFFVFWKTLGIPSLHEIYRLSASKIFGFTYAYTFVLRKRKSFCISNKLATLVTALLVAGTNVLSFVDIEKKLAWLLR